MNRKLLQCKEYMYLLSAQAISNLGDWLDILALLALVGLKWHGSPIAVSITMLCLAVPSIVFGSFAGVLADRFERKHLMIAADILRAVIVIGVAFSTQLWQVYALLCVKSLFAAVFEPAKEGKLKEIVDDELMQPAVATSELINNGAKIVGPIISGLLVAGIGIQWSFYLDSLSFLASAALLLGVPKSVKRAKVSVEASEASASLIGQFKAGFTFMKKIPALLTGLIVFAVMILVLQLGDSQFVVLLREIPGDPIHVLGWIMAGSGAGVVIASLYLNKKEIRSCLTALTLASAGLGAGYIMAGLCIHLPMLWVSILYPAAGIVFGFCFGMGLIPFNVMAQKLTPSDYTGRVFGTISSVTTLAAVTGMLGGGFLTEWFGVVNTYVISGGLLVLIGVIVYSFRKRMQGGEINAKGDAGPHREAQG